MKYIQVSAIASLLPITDPSTKAGQNFIVATVSLASLLGALDMSIVNITVPTIDKAWQIPVGVGSLIIISYMLTITGLILFMGKLGDRYGFRKTSSAGLRSLASGHSCAGSRPMSPPSFYPGSSRAPVPPCSPLSPRQ